MNTRTADALYRQVSPARFAPTKLTESPWDQSLQHGGPPAALLLGAVEREHHGAGRIAAARVDFLGPIPRDTGEIAVQAVRPGRRIRLDEATLTIAGRVVARAQCWMVATGPDRSPRVEHPSEPLPPISGPGPGPVFPGFPQAWHYPQAIDWRPVHGTASLGPAAVWTRLRVPLIEDQPPTPLERLAVVADSANGLSRELPLDRFLFIPTALDLALHRHPAGEWILLDARTSLAGDGIGVTTVGLSDIYGPIGSGSQPLLVEPRPAA